LRDIEACLAAQPAKLWHMGFDGPVRRSTLADADEVRDWRIYAEFAQRMIVRTRPCCRSAGSVSQTGQDNPSLIA
jgi:hypothetical protein